jgi:hypothetical protein
MYLSFRVLSTTAALQSSTVQRSRRDKCSNHQYGGNTGRYKGNTVTKITSYSSSQQARRPTAEIKSTYKILALVNKERHTWSNLDVDTEYKPRPQRVHASKNNAVHIQQHILAQLYSATLV